MRTLTLPTTMHCAGCIASIKPFFDADKSIQAWNADVKSNPSTITVTGEHVTKEHIAQLLHEAGYDVLEKAETKSAALPEIGKPTTGFWGDKPIWKRASFNTLNCLIGCSIGDFSSVVIMQGFFPGTPMAVQMVVAVISGLVTSVSLETVIMHRREEFPWRKAFITALSMSFLSMIAMELAMNTSDFMMTGGKSSFTSIQYWMAFGVAAVVGFLTPLPYNYYRLKKHNKACH